MANRLSLFQLCALCSVQAIAPYGGQVSEMLQQCCGDPFHEVNLQACRGIQCLAQSVGMMLHSVSKHLMAAAMPLLTHRRHKVSRRPSTFCRAAAGHCNQQASCVLPTWYSLRAQCCPMSASGCSCCNGPAQSHAAQDWYANKAAINVNNLAINLVHEAACRSNATSHNILQTWH